MNTPANPTPAGPSAHVPVDVAPGRLVFGWLLVGIPLVYGIVTTLSRVGQLFQ